MRKRIVLLFLSMTVAVTIALTCVPKSAAERSNLERFSVPFSIPFGVPCADLPPGVTQIDGVANFFLITTTRVDDAGVVHLNINGRADGDAIDNNGVSYHFNYANHLSIDAPDGDFPQQFRMTDHFNLNGKGKDAHMQVGFVIRGTVEDEFDPFPFHSTTINIRGDAFNCDPI